MDIARALGTDRSTVSRVMNAATRSVISPDTVERVLKAAAEMGYRPNLAAASLRTSRSHSIGVIITDVVNPFFPPLLLAVEAAIEKAGYLPIVSSARGSEERQSSIVENLISRQVDGIVLSTSFSPERIIQKCQQVGLPLALAYAVDPHGRVPSVIDDGRCGSALVVEHLLQLGHRRIAHLAGPRGSYTGAQREAGFLDAMKSGRANVGKGHVTAATHYTREAGQIACRKLLEARALPTAIVAASDLLAMGCLDALRERGLRCPNDVSLTGYGDTFFSDLLAPALTTVRVEATAIGTAVAEILLGLLGGGPAVHERRTVLAPQLIVRKSTGVLRA